MIPRLHRATHQIGLWLERLEDPAVTQAEAHILAHLAAHGDSTVAELHRTLAHRRSTLTSVLDRLSAAGFIRRSISDDDRRSVVVALTASGKRAARTMYTRLARLEQQALDGLSPRSVQTAIAVLDALAGVAAERPAARAAS